MKSIQLLHDTAEKERVKSQGLRKEAEKHRQKAQDNLDNPDVIITENNEAQRNEEKASQHDQEAAALEKEATELEAKALELNRRKNEIQATSQAQMNKLDQEEKMLRGQ